MKGIIFLKPLEFSIETSGESWHQGEKVKGSIKVKNHGNERVELKCLKVALLSGNYKKIKSRDPKSWQLIIDLILHENIFLMANEELESIWEFSLPEDCRISDKDGSLYLTFFDKDDAWPSGNIELTIKPKRVITQFLEVVDNFLRFKIGAMKSVKDMIEIKLTPPSSRELSHVDSLVLRMKEVDKNLKLEYVFHLRTLEMNGAAMSAQKSIKEFDQTLNSKQCYIYGDSLNQDFIVSSVSTILNEVKPKMMM